jgi:hypothetical protein
VELAQVRQAAVVQQVPELVQQALVLEQAQELVQVVLEQVPVLVVVELAQELVRVQARAQELAQDQDQAQTGNHPEIRDIEEARLSLSGLFLYPHPLDANGVEDSQQGNADISDNRLP